VEPGLIWILVGLGLLGAEMLLPGVYLLWIGVAAIGTGLLLLTLAPGFGVAVAVFLVLLAAGVGLSLMIRRRGGPAHRVNAPEAGLAGRQAMVVSTEHGALRVRVGDSDWPARLPRGCRAARRCRRSARCCAWRRWTAWCWWSPHPAAPMRAGDEGARPRCRARSALDAPADRSLAFLPSAPDQPAAHGRKEAMACLTRRSLLAASGAALALPAIAQPRYPNRPIQLIVPWGAGGGTDATARIVGSLLERDLGQPVNVVNRTGGSGVVGHSAIATAAPDGYTIGMLTVEIAMMHWQGLTELRPTSYTPLALMNEDPPGVTVNQNAPWQTVQQLAEAIKASRPGQLKASGTGQGGIWHLALVGWLQAMGLRADHVRWVPSNGAAPAMQDLAAGGIDLCTCSIPEARAIIDAGRAKALAIMAPQRNPMFANVPTLNETLGINYSTGAWRGIAGPRNMPAEIAATLSAALKRAFDNREFHEFMNARGFGTVWGDAPRFASFMAESDRAMGDAMRAAGLARG
jgi:tripartite-type tricarboxylate transporter receptor subunit TctC/membrane protein implicated in regulation of membrane protease activity